MNETIIQKPEVRPNTTITAIYTHLGPAPAPVSGATWDASVDQPRVHLRLELPSAPKSSHLADYLRADKVVLGIILDAFWGTSATDCRYAEMTVSAPTVREAYDTLLQHTRGAVLMLASIIDARNDRLAQRGDTIRASRVDSPFTHVD